MRSWHLERYATINLIDRMNALESRVAILESNNKMLEDTLKRRWDNAVKRLEPEILERCYCKVYDRESLISLLDLIEEKKKGGKDGA